MEPTYSWDDLQAGARKRSLVRMVVGAIAVAVILHAALLYFFGRIPFVVELTEAFEWQSRPFHVEQVEFIAEDTSPEATPEVEEVPKPPDNPGSLVTEIEELLPRLENLEVDISPDIPEPEVPIKMEIPALIGSETGELLETLSVPEVAPALSEIGTGDLPLTEVPDGRVVIDEGSLTSELSDPDEFLQDAISKGAGGLSDAGVLEGYTSLGDLLGLPAGELNRTRTALPSDLLFDYDSDELREGARLGLMKLAILIDRNPDMFCILEGHTDLFGGDEYNMELSRRRAEAVKGWLVSALQLEGDRIVVRALGKTEPKVMEGTRDEQALNRRVDILMRKEKPVDVPVRAVVEEEPPPVRAEPVEDPPRRAIPVEEGTEPPVRAVPVGE